MRPLRWRYVPASCVFPLLLATLARQRAFVSILQDGKDSAAREAFVSEGIDVAVLDSLWQTQLQSHTVESDSLRQALELEEEEVEKERQEEQLRQSKAQRLQQLFSDVSGRQTSAVGPPRSLAEVVLAAAAAAAGRGTAAAATTGPSSVPFSSSLSTSSPSASSYAPAAAADVDRTSPSAADTASLHSVSTRRSSRVDISSVAAASATSAAAAAAAAVAAAVAAAGAVTTTSTGPGAGLLVPATPAASAR